MCSVCVCVRIHTNTPTYTPTRIKNQKTQDSTFISPSIKNYHPRQATSALYRLFEHPYPCCPTRMNKLRARMYTPCSNCVADMYCDVKNTCGMNTPACTGVQDTCLVHTTLTSKIHIHPCKHARATVQQCLHYANHCDLSYNLSSVQETARFHNSPWRSRSCVDTHASSDHMPWCRPHPFCLLFAFALG